MTKEDRERKKKELEDKKLKYSFVYIDGMPQKIGATIEPPGIFMGRGMHPNMGSLKPRIGPKDVTINISKGAKPPKLPAGYGDKKWGRIIHDNTVEWIASYPFY